MVNKVTHTILAVLFKELFEHIAAIGHVPDAVSQYIVLSLHVYINLFSLIVLHKLVADVYETLLVTFNLDERYMHLA